MSNEVSDAYNSEYNGIKYMIVFHYEHKWSGMIKLPKTHIDHSCTLKELIELYDTDILHITHITNRRLAFDTIDRSYLLCKKMKETISYKMPRYDNFDITTAIQLLIDKIVVRSNLKISDLQTIEGEEKNETDDDMPKLELIEEKNETDDDILNKLITYATVISKLGNGTQPIIINNSFVVNNSKNIKRRNDKQTKNE
jgi:hypothetical protein